MQSATQIMIIFSDWIHLSFFQHISSKICKVSPPYSQKGLFLVSKIAELARKVLCSLRKRGRGGKEVGNMRIGKDRGVQLTASRANLGNGCIAS